MQQYEALSKELSMRIEREMETGTFVKLAFEDQNAVRRAGVPQSHETVFRTPFIRDIDKILYCPFYSRCADKTQVFSLYKNDDITRRSLHVQLVSRIARTIGRALNLNQDLIEAIALGHDIGHTPFAHTGERYLDELYFNHTGRHFLHSIHSVRVLDGIFPYHLTLQTLDGIACHNGEQELYEYHPSGLSSFEEFDRMIENCYTDGAFMNTLIPATLEGCVVRISDIIAYLGKDRVDAVGTKLVTNQAFDEEMDSFTNKLINDLIVNIIECSYGKPYIRMDEKHFTMLKDWKRENYSVIYNNAAEHTGLSRTVKPMMGELYEHLLHDLENHNTKSPIFSHHIRQIRRLCGPDEYRRRTPYEETEMNQIVVDYIASMTDDYLVDLHHFIFPNSQYSIRYKGYFD